jgi:hypothetical protein
MAAVEHPREIVALRGIGVKGGALLVAEDHVEEQKRP